MTITNCHLYEYRLRLKQPIGSGDAPIFVREGLLVRFTNESGFATWGEAAPLAGFSDESMEEARSQLIELIPKLVNADIPAGVENRSKVFENWLGQYGLCPSVRCAVEMAVIDLVREEQPAGAVPVNGLIGGAKAEVTERAGDFIKRGFKTVKLKVGRGDKASDIARVKAVDDAIGGQATLRLDANRAWSLEEALQFARGVEACEVEYIEEPLKDTSQLGRFTQETGVPIALDETLREIEPHDLQKFAPIVAVILKPTLLGGFERAAAFARAASAVGAKVVVTSTFESPIGVASLARFAATHGSADTAAGLETIDWFEEQLLSRPISLAGGVIDLTKAVHALTTVDQALLTEIDMSRGANG